MSRSDLARRTGLMKSTVSSHVDELLGRGLIEEVGFQPSGVAGGRRAILLQINADSRVVAGIQVGVRQTTVVVADALGIELASCSSATARSSPDDTLAAAAGTVGHLLADQGIPSRKLSAVGIALPGLVDHRTGACRIAPNLGWRNVRVADTLTGLLGVPVFVNNTAQAMAVAESHAASQDDIDNHDTAGNNSGRDGDRRRDLVLLYVGTGVGAALVEQGRIFRGSGGFAGEIGHMDVDSRVSCACGKVGCLETRVSGPAIVRRALESGVAVPQSDGAIAHGAIGSSVITPGDVSPETIGRAAEAGDTAAQELLTDVGAELGRAAAWLTQITNPSMLVIAGRVSTLGAILINPLRETVRRATLPAIGDALTIRQSRLDSRAKLRGAILIALRRLDEPV